MLGFRRPSQLAQNVQQQQQRRPEEEVDSLQKRAQELPEDPRTQTTHHRDLAITQASLLPAHENEKKLEESVTATRRNSLMEQGKYTVTKSVSPAPSRTTSVSSAKRPMTPQEFLCKIQDFVKNSEMDAEYAQPVWPATVSSEKDLPAYRPVTEAFRARKSSLAGSEVSSRGGQRSFQQQPPNISIEEPQVPQKPPTPVEEVCSVSKAVEKSTIKPPEAPPRQRSPRPGYGPKPRDHSPFCVEGPSIFDECLRNPLTSIPKDAGEEEEPPIPRPQLSSRIAPSPGKSYLDKPSTSPDPFGARVEMDAPPSVNQAAAASSSIMSNLRREADQRKYESEIQMDDVITLDLRTNQEKLEYLSVPSDYSHKNSAGIPGTESDVQTNSSLPNRGRSPRKTAREVIPADRHIPQQLQPDPLTAHETVIRQPDTLQLASFGSGYIPTEDGETIQDTDLYKKLKVGLDRLMSTEKFKTLSSQTSLDQQGLDHQSYSQHLGRAEFGELRRKRTTSTTSFQGITSPTASSGGQQQSRDSSNERPASALARMAGSERGGRGGQRPNFSSQPTSRDSSFGRHDSRQDDYF